MSLTDISGYIVGRLVGNRKLCKSISPKKTFEGFLASIILPSLIFYIYFIIFQSYVFLTIDLFFIIFCCLSCTLGDLTVSIHKRTFSVKDSGSIFPGHGGLLDRMDSYLPTVFIFQFWMFI